MPGQLRTVPVYAAAPGAAVVAAVCQVQFRHDQGFVPIEKIIQLVQILHNFFICVEIVYTIKEQNCQDAQN